MTTRGNQDPTAEIRDALDREVARRFDARRLSGGPTLVAAPDPGVRRRGPLGSLPIGIQWAAVAAALLGAVLGVRSFVLERRQVAPPAAAAATAPPSEPLVADADVPRPTPPPLDTHTREPRPKPPSPERPRQLAAPPAEPQPLQAPVASPRPEAPGPRRSERPATVPPVGSVIAQAVPPAPRKVEGPAGPAVGFGVVSPAVDLGLVGGVRVKSFAIGGRDVKPFVREVREVGATLVVPQRLRASRTPRPAAAIPAVLWRTMTAPSLLLATTTETEDEAQPAGAYYARLFLGSAFDDGSRSQGLMGEGLQVVPLREAEIWGDEAQEQFLKRLFDLRYVVAVDGARIAPKEEGGEASASFLAGVNGELLDVSVQGKPTKTEGVHAVDLRVSYRADDPSTGPRVLEARLLIENGRIVVLGLPGRLTRDASPTMTFIALSPQFDRFAEPAAAGEIVVPTPDMDPPVLVERAEIVYPENARKQRVEGRVILQAVIRKDGSVDGVQVLRVPDVKGADYLVEAAATSVRQWRYLPARRDGEAVDCYFTIVVEFAMK